MATSPATLNADQFCYDTARASRSNFLVAFAFLPRERQRALYSFYAYCRLLDDIADSTKLTVAEKNHQLETWQKEIDGLYQDRPQHLVTQALQPHLIQFNIPQVWLRDILHGVRQDLTVSHYNDFSALYRYCYHVAGAVGLVCTRIFGCSSPRALAWGETLGIAFQLTNILRDMGQDFRDGRVYIPIDEIHAAGLTPETLISGTGTAAFLQLMQTQWQRAASYYQMARDLYPHDDAAQLLPANLMTHYYQSLLHKIRRANFPTASPVRLSRAHKMLLLTRLLPRLWTKVRSAA